MEVDRPALLGMTVDSDDPAAELYRCLGWRRLGRLDSAARIMGSRP